MNVFIERSPVERDLWNRNNMLPLPLSAVCVRFPSQCLEELDLSMNQLGDGVSESLSCLLSCCPLLAKLSLQACGLTARFLQQHRLLLANALTGD